MGALDTWVAAVPAEKVLPSVVDFLPSAKASNEGKVTGLRWIMGLVNSREAQRCLDSALKAAAVASGDKAVEVREAASHLAAALVKVGNPLRLTSRLLSTSSVNCQLIASDLCVCRSLGSSSKALGTIDVIT